MKAKRYTITHHSQECQCEQCGYPLYVEDKVVTEENEEHSFCTKKCLNEYHDDKGENHEKERY
jgi:hypothetical protein